MGSVVRKKQKQLNPKIDQLQLRSLVLKDWELLALASLVFQPPLKNPGEPLRRREELLRILISK